MKVKILLALINCSANGDHLKVLVGPQFQVQVEVYESVLQSLTAVTSLTLCHAKSTSKAFSGNSIKIVGKDAKPMTIIINILQNRCESCTFALQCVNSFYKVCKIELYSSLN